MTNAYNILTCWLRQEDSRLVFARCPVRISASTPPFWLRKRSSFFWNVVSSWSVCSLQTFQDNLWYLSSELKYSKSPEGETHSLSRNFSTETTNQRRPILHKYEQRQNAEILHWFGFYLGFLSPRKQILEEPTTSD